MNEAQNTGLLPLGSVVILTNGEKRLMIIGRKQISAKSKKRFDYAGILFPEGYQKADELILFNNSDVEQIFQMGLIDSEELAFQNLLQGQEADLMTVKKIHQVRSLLDTTEVKKQMEELEKSGNVIIADINEGQGILNMNNTFLRFF